MKHLGLGAVWNKGFFFQDSSGSRNISVFFFFFAKFPFFFLHSKQVHTSIWRLLFAPKRSYVVNQISLATPNNLKKLHFAICVLRDYFNPDIYSPGKWNAKPIKLNLIVWNLLSHCVFIVHSQQVFKS